MAVLIFQVYPLEGAVSILSGKAAVALSQQEVLSCAYEDDEGRNGCNGRLRLLFRRTTFL